MIVWRVHSLLVLAVFVPFVTLDALFLTSACTKVPDGAWFTLLLAVVLASVFILWRYGKEAQWKAEAGDVVTASLLLAGKTDGNDRLHASFGGAMLTTIKGTGIFFDKQGGGIPTAYSNMLQKFEARPEIQIFLHVRALPSPTVPMDDRYSVALVPSIANCYRVVIRHGYNDQVITEDLGSICVREVRRFLIGRLRVPEPPPLGTNHSNDTASKSHAISDDGDHPISRVRSIELASVAAAALDSNSDAETSLRIRTLDTAVKSQTVFIVGKEELRIHRGKSVGSWHESSWWADRIGKDAVRRAILGVFLLIKENTRAKVSSMGIPIDKLVEVGFVKEM